MSDVVAASGKSRGAIKPRDLEKQQFRVDSTGKIEVFVDGKWLPKPKTPDLNLKELRRKRISHVGDSEGYPEDSYPSGGTDEPEEDSEGNPKDMDSAESDDEPEGEQV